MSVESEFNRFDELRLTDQLAKHAVLSAEWHAHLFTGIERRGPHELDHRTLRHIFGARPGFKL